MTDLQKLIAKAMRSSDKRYRDFAEALQRDLRGKKDSEIAAIVKKNIAAYGIKNDFVNQVSRTIIEAVSIGTSKGISPDKVASFKRWLLEKSPLKEGLKYIGKNYGEERAKEIIADVRYSLKTGESWRMAAQKLQDNVGLKTDVAKDVKNVLANAKKSYLASNNPEEYAKYKSEIARLQRRIDKMAKPSTSKLKRAYQDVVDLTKKYSDAQYENAIKYTAYFKERYNAERITRTEAGRAYGDAAFSDALQDGDAIGVQFILSSGHPAPDQCDFVCSADLYGMGPGIYPKEYAPEYPIHPQCMCGLVKVYEGEAKQAGKSDFNPKGGEKYLNSVSENVRKSIIGAKSSSEDWEAALERKGFRQETKKEIIPKKYLK